MNMQRVAEDIRFALFHQYEGCLGASTKDGAGICSMPPCTCAEVAAEAALAAIIEEMGK